MKSSKLLENYNNIKECNNHSEKIIHNLKNLKYGKDGIPFDSEVIDFVVFGSIARGEATEGSDIDWTCLVDGIANPDHHKTWKSISNILEKNEFKGPGKSGVFGDITFSHDLIHYIGGNDDTNQNLTRRILLLLESCSISIYSGQNEAVSPHERVLRNIIKQYVKNDSGLDSKNPYTAPRFLLNDIVRFWRTMCVDFAFKQREDEGKKWAIRNIKLRMSRKLLYVKGLFMCYRAMQTQNSYEVEESLLESSKKKPLTFIANFLIENKVEQNKIENLFGFYNEYLGILNDISKREILEKIEMKKAYENGLFLDAREIAENFQKSLSSILMNNKDMNKFVNKYVIF